MVFQESMTEEKREKRGWDIHKEIISIRGSAGEEGGGWNLQEKMGTSVNNYRSIRGIWTWKIEGVLKLK